MFNILIENLQLIAVLIVTYLSSLAVNTLLGIYYNLNTIHQDFSKEKLIKGLIRGGIILVSGLALTVIISMMPEFLNYFGINAENNLFENVSVVAMAGVLVSTIVKYLTDGLKKFYNVLNLFGGNTIYSEADLGEDSDYDEVEQEA